MTEDIQVHRPAQGESPSPSADTCPPAPRGGARFLVVDDDPAVARLVKRVLHPFDVTVACGGEHALRILEDDVSWAAILCDYTMPGIDGEEFFDAVRALSPGLERRILFMTGGACNEHARQFLARVPHPPILKPFEVPDLRSRIVQASRAA